MPTIWLHCSDSPYGDAALIDKWHSQRGFKRKEAFVTATHPHPHIGYAYVILNGRIRSSKTYETALDGVVENGRTHAEVMAHARGENTAAIPICLVGRDGQYTANQLVTMYTLCSKLILQYSLRPADVRGHYESKYEQTQGSAAKTCPNLPMGRVRSRLSSALGALQTFYLST